MTKVKFYKDIDGELFAYFPEIRYNDTPKIFTCYYRIGQHSACHENYAKGCKQAEYREYRELLKELIGQGYNDLRIMNTQIFSYHRKPTPSEIKQGYGAIHYRPFTLAETGITKAGNLKKWFIAADGLRYYR
jgi:hypothetical protein